MPLCQISFIFRSVLHERKMPLFEVWVLTCTDRKSRHLKILRLTDFEYWDTNLIF